MSGGAKQNIIKIMQHKLHNAYIVIEFIKNIVLMHVNLLSVLLEYCNFVTICCKCDSVISSILIKACLLLVLTGIQGRRLCVWPCSARASRRSIYLSSGLYWSCISSYFSSSLWKDRLRLVPSCGELSLYTLFLLLSYTETLRLHAVWFELKIAILRN